MEDHGPFGISTQPQTRANLQGTLHPIREPYQIGKEGLGYSGNSGNSTPLTWTLKAHFV